MDLTQYQADALETKVPHRGDPVSFYLHGLTGEVGSIAAEYKKLLRDGAASEAFLSQAAEEMGDALWYLAALANEFGLDLSQIAEENLDKVRDRWVGRPTDVNFDEGYPAGEAFPRRFVIKFTADDDVVEITDEDGNKIGDRLTDNAHAADGYRFHDVIHLANASVLGWSPTVRSLLKRKRKSRPEVDEVEDGARAIFTDEAIAATVFTYAARHKFLEGLERIDSQVLGMVQGMVVGLEVTARSGSDWESAILQAFEVWRALEANDGGSVMCDLDRQSISILPPI